MAILNRDDTEFKTVNKVFNNRGNNTQIQRVWVHNGTTYVLVKGRTLEAVWEKDLSTYGGMSWDGIYSRTPDKNILKSMHVLRDGNLLGVVDYVINNGKTNQYSSGRSALLNISATDGTISPFSTYTPWSSWPVHTTNYLFTAQPIGIIPLGDYYIAYSEHGIFYSFTYGGTFRSMYENKTWHTRYSDKVIDADPNWGVHVDYNPNKGCIYYAYSDYNENNIDSSSYLTSIYRIGVDGYLFYTPRRHYIGEREARYYNFCTNIVIDKEQEKGIVFFKGESDYDSKLMVMDCYSSFSSSSTDYAAVCALIVYSDEYLVAAKDGYVYTSDKDGYIKKRKISDLSIVWSVHLPSVYASSSLEYEYIHQPLPECDGGFMLPNGCVLYPDGNVTKERKLFSDSNYNDYIRSFCFDESQGIGYMMGFSHSLPQCSVVKFKEVKR